ncbi:MAG: helix-turn-helix transcriptional regulator [Nocardioidaceae bacterium]
MTARLSAVELIADIASICADPSPSDVRARAVLDRLKESIPFETAALATYNPFTNEHVTVAELNYTDDVLDFLNVGFVSDDPAYQTMRYRNHTPLRWCDIPGYEQMFSAHEVFIPAGFREGSTTCFFTRDGRYTGAFHLNSDLRLPISDQAVEALEALQRVIAPILDALRPTMATEWIQVVAGADEVALVTTTGQLVDIPGGHRHLLLTDDGALARDLISHGNPSMPELFYWIGPDGQSHEVQTVALAQGTIVAVRQAKPPYRLSPRELEVLTKLAEGMANPAIGQALSLSPRTVATHVEHILVKLECTTRVAAATTAVAEGIVRPPRRLVAVS